jgi:hypothetical protein
LDLKFTFFSFAFHTFLQDARRLRALTATMAALLTTQTQLYALEDTTNSLLKACTSLCAARDHQTDLSSAIGKDDPSGIFDSVSLDCTFAHPYP